MRSTVRSIVFMLCLSTAVAFAGFHHHRHHVQNTPAVTTTALFASPEHLDRRRWLARVAATAVLLPSTAARAVDTAAAPEMKTFVDPQGYFAITIPKNYFALRRSSKGDLPDATTGQGRRGSSIFTAGDMAKAEVVAVERFPTRLLLEEAGIEATGDLSTFPGLGEPAAVANLITLRREKDKPGSSKTDILPDSLALSEDGLSLYFTIKTEIDVQKPELLMEEYGVSQLFRVTAAKASLASRDGNIMAVFASALEQDFNGKDGEALRNAVNSFTVVDQSGKVS